MKLKSFNYLFSLLIILLVFTPLKSDEQIDIWKNDKNKSLEKKNLKDDKNSQKLNFKTLKKIKNKQPKLRNKKK